MGTTPIDRSTTWPYEDGEPGAFTYSRFSSPTIAEAERRLGELDGGEALLFASGTAACTSIALALLAPGQTVALAGGRVLRHRRHARGARAAGASRRSSSTRPASRPTASTSSGSRLRRTRFSRCPTSKLQRRIRPASSATRRRRRRSMSVPLDHGCDLVVHSATKYLAGHDDALLGAVVCKSRDDAARLLEFRSRTGPVPNADTAWLLLRGLSTLEVRVARQTETASAIADRLRAHSAVRDRPLPRLRRPPVVRRGRRGRALAQSRPRHA